MKQLYRHTILLIVLCCSIFAAQNANAQGWEWAQGLSNLSEGTNICAIDTLNNIYVAGSWGGANVIKYDSSGSLLWSIATVGGNPVGALSLTTDLFGNEYLLGSYDTTLTFGGHVLTSPGPRNYYFFISKINSDGSVEWIKGIGNVWSWGIAGFTTGIATDNVGHIYITCTFSNNPTIGSISLTNANPDSSTDILVAKFDSSGTVIWAKSFGGKDWEYPYAISVTPSHNVYIDGYYNYRTSGDLGDTLAFGSTSLIDTDIYVAGFLAKLDSNGNAIWARSEYRSQLVGLTSNSNEDVFITGAYFGDSLTIGSYVLPEPPAIYDNYGLLAKYDSSGNAIWAKGMQGNNVYPKTSTIDPCGNIWIISSMGNNHITTADIIDGHILAPPAINGAPNFIACWTNAGTFISAVAMESGGPDPNVIVSDRCGNIYVSADQESCDTMTIATDTFIITSSDEKQFIAKYNPNLSCGSCGISVMVNSIGGDTILCNGDTTTLTDITTGGTWSSSNPSIATVGSATGLVTAFAIGTATITYSVGTGYVTKTVSVDPAPSAIIGNDGVCWGLTDTLNDSTVGGVWSSSNTAVASVGSITGIVTGLFGGTTTITYAVSAGCYVTMPITVYTLCNDGIQIITNNTNQVSIFPNPASTQLTIQSSNEPITQVTITNPLSQTIYTQQLTSYSKQAQINVSSFPPSIYFVKINGTEVRKFVKE